MASILMSAALTLGLALPASPAFASAPAGGGDSRVLAVDGPVELSPAHAMRSAEGAMRDAILERFAASWRAERAFWVPAKRFEHALDRNLRHFVSRSASVARRPVEAIETSLGMGYRQRYELSLAGRSARSLSNIGYRIARSLNEEFAVRWGAMGGLWVLLFLIGFGLDRATRGWITGRIALATTGLGGLVTWLLLP